VNFAVFVLILTSKLPVPSPLLSFILNLTTATHCTISSTVSDKKLLNIQISLARAVTRTPKSSHITPVLKSLHWLNINKHIKYKLLSIIYKVLTTHQLQHLHDSISVQPCHNTRSSSMVAHLPAPLWKSQIALLACNFVYEMNSPLISASLVRHSFLHFLLSHMAVHHLRHLHYHRLHLLLLAQYFILNSGLGSSANPFLHRPFPFTSDLLHGLSKPSNDFTLLNGWIGICVRLNWLQVCFRMHFKSLHFHSFVVNLCCSYYCSSY